MITRPTYINRIKPFINKDLIKILTGIRRCGKSIMLELIKKELLASGVNEIQFISLNFEDADNMYLCTYEKLHEYLSKEIKNINDKTYLFLDEIQEVEGWQRCINSLRIKYDCDIYVTGSNAKLLSGELATYIAGRYVEFVIYPFSFLEFCELNKNAYKTELFKNYVAFGGMPFLMNLNYEPDPCNQYLKDLYNSVVLKDIVKRNNIRDVDLLERIIIYVLANVGKTFSATSISKYFKNENRKVSPETILNYIKACEDAFLFYKVKRQDLIGKKILTVNEKYYVVDHGLREAIYGKNNRDIEIILENIIYMELIRRGYKVTVGKTNDFEIDFVVEKQKDIIYIQVAYLLASEKTIEREFKSLEIIKDNYPKYVISMDEFDFGKNGIKHFNLIDFLLSDF